jgi:hypothetical protein
MKRPWRIRYRWGDGPKGGNAHTSMAQTQTAVRDMVLHAVSLRRELTIDVKRHTGTELVPVGTFGAIPPDEVKPGMRLHRQREQLDWLDEAWAEHDEVAAVSIDASGVAVTYDSGAEDVFGSGDVAMLSLAWAYQM